MSRRQTGQRVLRRLLFERLEGRLPLSVTFVESEQSFGDTAILDVAMGDFDNDGDQDLVVVDSSGGATMWLNLAKDTRPGDANRDFQFDQQDIVQVLQAAKYLTGEGATWQEGDWNDDGVFDQLDIVAALQTRNYLHGP